MTCASLSLTLPRLLVQEKLMNPKPDFGYETYKGCGRLKGKV